MTFDPEINELLKFDLSEALQNMMDLAYIVDDNYHVLTNNNLMRYWQSKNVTLKSVLITDLLDWLCCLAFSDGFIAPEEVKFINDYLKQDLTADDIIEHCRFRINQDYFKKLPLSFVLLYEHDLIMKSMNLNEDINSVELLYALFMVMGVQFIYCDNEAALKELSQLNEYGENLSKRIHDFNLMQSHLTILEMSDGKTAEDYFENRYSFTEEIITEYHEELEELDNLKDLNEEIQNIDFSPWRIEPINNESDMWTYKQIDSEYSWKLEKNINDYYDFSDEFDNHLADISEILTLETQNKFKNTHLTPYQYKSILNKIKSTSDNILFKIFNDNCIDFNSLSLFEKVLLFTKSFVESDYKSYGEQLGEYSYNRIHIDERVHTSFQIATLIHELSHHLLAEIFEQTVMILLNTDKTDAVEMFVDMSFHSSNCFILLNEYCAHLVENHFTPREYHNYGSFLKVLEEFDLNNENDNKRVYKSMMIGNTFSHDIVNIIKPFIDDNLTEQIKHEFKKDFNDMANPMGISYEIDDTFDIYDLLVYINFILITCIEEYLKDSES